ncbi:MAG: cobalamin-dependent protein [Candidatus Lokiarchaeota archaeon]|nr:cobalamin-dependent protein [Candidatus Lokiarchaeota archaeon]
MFEESMKKAILEWDEDGLKKICQTTIENKEATPAEIIKSIGKIMQFVGKRFEQEEIFLPDLVGSANTVKAVIDEVLDPAIKAIGEERETRGKIVIGTVETDVHSIGKDLVGSFLFSNGFEVYNLGEEVPAVKFIEKAEEVGAQVIALSSLLTMSMDFQRQLIQELEDRGLRNKYKVIVGGSPTSEEWAEQIGADGWADDAIEAVSLMKKLLT